MPPQAFLGHALQAGIQGGEKGGLLSLGRGSSRAQRLPGRMRRNAGAGCVGAAFERGLGQHREPQAIGLRHGSGLRAGLQHVAPDAAGPPGHLGDRCVGRANQRGGDGGFAVVQAMCGLAEQGAGQGIDADELAAPGDEVEVGLEHPVLAPAPIEHRARDDLADLVEHRALARAGPVAFAQQADKLHADGRCAPGAFMEQMPPGRSRDRRPVHAAVRVEAPVLAEHQRQAQRA